MLEELSDEVRLAGQVRSAVRLKQRGELALERGVPGGLGGMSPQEVPQVYVIVVRLAATDDHIQVVTGLAWPRAERVPARNTQITFMLPSGGCERVDRRGHPSRIRDHRIKVDDGLGGQAGHSSAPNMHRDMLDTSQRHVYLAAEPFKLLRPARVIRHDSGQNMHATILGDDHRHR